MGNKKILVAVSGGIDSMTLLDLLIKSKCNVAVAHANFQLRKIISYYDQIFVNNFCLKYNIPFYSKLFDTKKYAIENKISIQMAARKLRYDWFDQLINNENYDYLALGHNLNDSIETFFINLIRGSGIKGLSGIPLNRGKIIRPLLNFNRLEIFTYANTRKILWREDLSNQENKYLRNFIRNHLIPVFQKIPGNFYKSLKKTIYYLTEENFLIEKEIQRVIKKITINKNNNPFYWEINSQILQELHPINTYLFKLFSPYGFTNIIDLNSILYAQSGKQLFSNSYRLIKNRNHLILTEKFSLNQKIFKIINLNPIKIPFHLYFLLSSEKDKKAIISIDFEKIKLPLYLRTWEIGDYFYPVGKKYPKKISKYFKQKKFSIIEKEKTWFLTNYDNSIIWIVKYDLDNRFKIYKNTKKILNIYL